MAEPPAEAKTKRRKKAGTEAPARRPGLRAVAATLPRVAKRALGRRGFAEGGLAVEWPSIVGEELAARCLPSKVAVARPGRRAEGTLTLRVVPGFATELQHLAPLILERVNGYFGYSAIGRLQLQQGPLPARRPPRRPPEPPLSPEEEAELKDRLAGVEDEELRGALERLGRAVRQQPGP
ncbi:MAG: DciA family protein [Kiloniellales bacterium]